MRSTKRTINLGAAVLVVALLVAQYSAVAHLSLDDSHPVDGSCAFCVGLADFDAGNVASTCMVDAFILPAEPIDMAVGCWAPRTSAHRLARGPPIAS